MKKSPLQDVAVDALLAVWDRFCAGDETVDEHDIGRAIEVVRASRGDK